MLDIDLGFYTWLREQRIRLLGIDAPEMTGAQRVRGEAAKAHLERLLIDKTLTIQTVKAGDPQDSFGRWLGVLYAGGENVNEAMVEAGKADRR